MAKEEKKVVIRYAEDVVGAFTLHRRPVKRSGGILDLLPGQGQDGYGSKITTDIMLKFEGQNREYRVYCTCYSNAGSNWITYNGEKLWLKTYFQEDVRDD